MKVTSNWKTCSPGSLEFYFIKCCWERNDLLRIQWRKLRHTWAGFGRLNIFIILLLKVKNNLNYDKKCYSCDDNCWKTWLSVWNGRISMRAQVNYCVYTKFVYFKRLSVKEVKQLIDS